MKITLEIPDGTQCAYINYIVREEDGPYEWQMMCSLLDARDIKDGAFIKIPRERKTDG